MEILNIILKLSIAIFAADFVSGFVHWAQDTFGTEETPLWGKWVVAPNILHHNRPAAFTKNNWIQSSWDLTLLSLIILAISWIFGVLTWAVWVFCIFGANANQIHKYTHLPKRSIPFVIKALQKLRLLQNAKDHARHHSGDNNMAYCLITPFLNPIMDKLRFWRMLEKITVPIFGAPRREDLNIVNEQRNDNVV